MNSEWQMSNVGTQSFEFRHSKVAWEPLPCIEYKSPVRLEVSRFVGLYSYRCIISMHCDRFR